MSMELVTTAPVNHGAVMRQIREKRLRPDGKPLAWRAVQVDLDLDDKQLRAYRWQIAAALRAENPRMAWKTIASNPAVDIPPATLKSHHKTAVLANGMTWAAYVGSYQEAMHARLAALQAAEGTKAAEDFFDGVKMLADEYNAHVALLRDQRLNPPQDIIVSFDAKGRPIKMDCKEQLVLEFPGLEGSETIKRERLSLAYGSKIRAELESCARGMKAVHWLLTGKRIEEETEDTSGASEAKVLTPVEMQAALEEIAEGLHELELYQPVEAAA